LLLQRQLFESFSAFRGKRKMLVRNQLAAKRQPVFRPCLYVIEMMEARVGIEPTHKGFADLSLTTWVPRPYRQDRCS
jgi:hypothetical protein